MEKIFGEARSLLIHDTEEERLEGSSDQNLILINKFTQKPVSREQVHVKSMWLCNDIIDSYFSRFTEESLQELAALVPGSPVMVGHSHDDLPIGKFFKASAERRDDSHMWLRAWFYWPIDMAGSADLLTGIESGLYNEVSACWSYETATCSICGKDIRGFECMHIPGKKYPSAEDPAVEKLCWYDMTNIKDFFEGSIVFKGGQYGTSIEDERKVTYTERAKILDKKPIIKKETENAIREIEFSKIPAGKYNISPSYDSHIININDRKIMLDDKDITERLPMISEEIKDLNGSFDGFIFRKRGNSRLHKDAFTKWIDSTEKDDHTIHIKLFDMARLIKDTTHVQAIKFITSETVTEELARTVASKEGVIIYNDEIKYIVKEIRHDDKTPSQSIPKTKPVQKRNEEVIELTDQDCEAMIDEDQDDRAKWDSKKKKGLPDAAFCPSLIKTVDGKKVRKCPHHNANVKNANEASSIDRAHLTAALRLVDKVQGFSSAAIASARKHLEMHKGQLDSQKMKSVYKVYEDDKRFLQFAIDGIWYRTPAHAGKSMIFREVEFLDEKRAMLLGPIETSVDEGVVTIESKPISGRYRMSNVTLNGHRLKVMKFLESNLE